MPPSIPLQVAEPEATSPDVATTLPVGASDGEDVEVLLSTRCG